MYPNMFIAGAVSVIILCLTLLKFLGKRKVQNLDSKYVFITGCDSGFGREIAVRLDKMGVRVLAACLTKQGEQDLTSMTSDQLKTFQMDVTDSQQIKDVFEQVKNMLPSEHGIWGLVNNAGISSLTPIEWTPLDQLKRIADVNLWGMMDVTKTFLPLVKKSQGRVINMSSMLGRVSLPGQSGYCISKYGVEAFSDALRREMSPWRVLVSLIEPGAFKTGIMNAERAVETMRKLWDDLSPELKKDYGDKYLGRVSDRIVEGLNACSSDTFRVVDAIVDALTSQRPQTRYAVGWDAKLMIFISFLPTFIADRFLKK